MNSDRPVLEIEVTPEMISAGIEVLCSFYRDDDPEVMLPAIFTAMNLASVEHSRKPFAEKKSSG